MTLIGAATLGDLDEFRACYEPDMAAEWKDRFGKTLLIIALGNTEHRAEICNFLLDEGADTSIVVQPDGYNCLHILLLRALDKSYPENNESDVALLSRLLEAGADINAVDGKYGTPLQAFSEKAMTLRDENLAVPFYEVLFSRPDLDLMKVGAFGRSTYWSIWNSSSRLPIMLDYADRHLRERGIPVPDLGAPPTPQTPSNAKDQP